MAWALVWQRQCPPVPLWGQAGAEPTSEAQGEAWGAGREDLHGGGLAAGIEDEVAVVGMERLGIRGSVTNAAMRSRKGTECLMIR